MNHILTQISYNRFPYYAHLKKRRFAWVKRKKCGEIARGCFSKITETARLLGWEFAADKSRYSGYITLHWNWINSYWMLWIGCLRGAHSVSSFCDFRKINLYDFRAFFSSLTQANLCFFVFQMFLLRSIKAYLCPNNSDFDGVDFSERHSEEVIGFFWLLSV